MATLSELKKRIPHLDCPSEPCVAWAIFQELTWAEKLGVRIKSEVVDYALQHLEEDR